MDTKFCDNIFYYNGCDEITDTRLCNITKFMNTKKGIWWGVPITKIIIKNVGKMSTMYINQTKMYYIKCPHDENIT